MSKELKVGDRVAVYGSVQDDNDNITFLRGAPGVIVESRFAPREFQFRPDAGMSEYTVHPKQCRRLVRKKRREAWIASFGNRNVVFTSIEKAKQGAWKDEDLTHVREVKRK